MLMTNDELDPRGIKLYSFFVCHSGFVIPRRARCVAGVSDCLEIRRAALYGFEPKGCQRRQDMMLASFANMAEKSAWRARLPARTSGVLGLLEFCPLRVKHGFWDKTHRLLEFAPVALRVSLPNCKA